MSEKNEKIIPNTFQNPNIHVDRAMELLSGDEYKVLNFATRHILGWQDKLNQGSAAISLTMLEQGYTTSGGARYGGTGLSRPALIAILKALCEYKLLRKAHKGADGQSYRLGEAPDWAGLEARALAKAEKQKARMEKVRTRGSGKSHLPVNDINQKWLTAFTDGGKSHLPVNDINQKWLTAFTDGGKSHLPKQSHIQNQLQSQKEKEKELFPIYGVPDNPPFSIPSQDELLAIADPAEQKATAEALFSALVAKVSPPQKQPFTDDEIQAQVAIAIARQKARQNAAEVQV